METDFQPSSKKCKLDVTDGGDVIVIDETTREDSGAAESGENFGNGRSLNRTEENYGLKLFVNKTYRISGILKQRYSDFLVRECDSEGNLVYLTDLSHCDKELDASKLATVDCPIEDEILLGKIEEFSTNEDKSKTFTLDCDNDKEHRKLVHKYIKDTYKDIETDTALLEDGSRAIRLYFKSNKSNKQQRKPGWPKDLPKFCHFVLFKENRDTMECIGVLAKMLHTNASNFGYAGTKDRRATTIQRVSVKNVYSKQLQNINDKLKNMTVGNFSYKEDGLCLGALSGNDFSIVLRDVLESDEQINLCCTSLKEKGFINYYGLQRFGTGGVPTHVIGKFLLESKFAEAINLILQYNENDNVRRFECAAKKIWQRSKDAKKALNAVRSRTSIEGRLLERLSNQTGSCYNYYNAFMALPRNNRSMYLHSYQSIIWNNMVTKRIEEFGLEPCEGDLILNKEKDENGHATVSILNKDDIDLKTFTIYDIVLPLPGYDVVYPSNKIAQYYKDALSADAIDIDNMKNKIKELSLSGSYRNVVVRPKDMSWQIEKYDDYTVSLIESDLEKLTGVTDGKEKSWKETACSNGKFKAIKLQMALPQSCYATTALREVLIADSSYQSQVTLNENTKRKI